MLKQLADAAPGHDAAGVQTERPVVALHRQLMSSADLEDIIQVAAGIGEIGSQFDSPAAEGLPFVEPMSASHLAQNRPQARKRLGIVRLDEECAPLQPPRPGGGARKARRPDRYRPR